MCCCFLSFSVIFTSKSLHFGNFLFDSFNVKFGAGGKRSKKRLTEALAASATGETLKPLVIGKSWQPRCFNKFKPSKLSVTYKANKKAWVYILWYGIQTKTLFLKFI